MAMLAASRFTVGNVLEEQSELDAERPAGLPALDHTPAFEAGLRLLVDGLAQAAEHAR